MSKHTLVISDSLLSDDLSGFLMRLGCTSDHVSTGKEGIFKASNHDYDLIVMDPCLPDIPGLCVTKIIRKLANKIRSKVPIIALTHNQQMRATYLGAGIQDIIEKPASFTQMKRVFTNHIASNDNKTHGIDQKDEAVDDNYLVREAAFFDILGKKNELKDAYINQDQKEMRQILHHIKGGVCYIDEPSLMKSVNRLHDVVRRHFQDKERLELAYIAAKKAMHDFCDDFSKTAFDDV